MHWIQQSFIVLLLALSWGLSSAHAQDELQAQRDACTKNTAMEWDSEMNRCVGRVQARQERHDAQDCNDIVELEARKACHMQLAKNKTSITDDPEEAGRKMTDIQSRSTIINTANTIVSAINMFAKDSSNSSCMSKQIFGITSLGGFLTDIYIKIQTKKKLNSLKDKFIVDNKDSAYNAQVKALEYLKEEQGVVKSIASQEKKRQMLLMIGYGAAAATAAYETFYNTSCYKPEPKKPNPAPEGEVKATADAPAPAPAAPAENTAQATPVEPPSEIETKPLEPVNAGVDNAVAPEKPGPTLHSTKNGNYQHNYLVQDGKVVGVVHNGQVYENFSTKNGVHYAQGKPSGAFNYNTGSWGNQRVSDVAITTNYNLSGGKISSGAGTTKVKNTSFGTGKK